VRLGVLQPVSGAAPFHSLHAVVEGYGTGFAARYAAMHLPAALASQGALALNRIGDAVERACRVVHDDLLVANVRQVRRCPALPPHHTRRRHGHVPPWIDLLRRPTLSDTRTRRTHARTHGVSMR
jgi:hypothetical protein